MYWQLIIVIVIVALAAAYLVRRAWRTWNKRGCGGGCGCATSKQNGQPVASTTMIPAEQLKLRRTT